jgi:hypothetical protein
MSILLLSQNKTCTTDRGQTRLLYASEHNATCLSNTLGEIPPSR